MGDTTQSPMTQETMTELVECNTQLHKTLQGLWSDALTQHKLQQHKRPSSAELALHNVQCNLKAFKVDSLSL